MPAITITFGDQAENHKGMQMIGTERNAGISDADLRSKFAELQALGHGVDLYDLNPGLEATTEPASVLVVRNGLESLFGHNPGDLYTVLAALPWDQKVFMYGRVANKHARYNLCFGDKSQAPDYEAKMGRVVR